MTRNSTWKRSRFGVRYQIIRTAEPPFIFQGCLPRVGPSNEASHRGQESTHERDCNSEPCKTLVDTVSCLEGGDLRRCCTGRMNDVSREAACLMTEGYAYPRQLRGFVVLLRPLWAFCPAGLGPARECMQGTTLSAISVQLKPYRAAQRCRHRPATCMSSLRCQQSVQLFMQSSSVALVHSTPRFLSIW